MEVRLLSDLNPSTGAGAEWETLVSSHPCAGVMQSLYWADFKRKMGLRTLHLGLYDAGTLIGGALFYCATSSRGSSFLVAPEGPVLPWKDEAVSSEGFRLLLREAERHAADYNAMALRVEPRIALPVPRVMRGFGRAPVNLIPRETLYLDLALSADELLASMMPKGRYNIRLSERHKVTVREERSLDVLKDFYPILLEAGRRDSFAVEPLPFFTALAEALCPAGIARFMIAEQEGETLGAMILTTYGKRATYLYGGIGNRKRNLMAGYALQWAAINKARSHGCTEYDMYGFDQFGSPTNNYARFSRFKRQFGGTVMRFIGGHDYFFIDSLADQVIKAINEISPAGESTKVRSSGCAQSSAISK